jgi:hypothetical protein
VAALLTSQFFDRREMPTMKPTMVARMMPRPATSSVLQRPTQKDQRLADVEAGSLVPKAEAGRDVRALEVYNRVTGGAVHEQNDHKA